MFGKWFIVIALGFISTVVHEGGHAVAAWQVGFKVKRIAVLPIEFDMARKRFGWASLPSKSDIVGYVQADVPINAGRRSAVIFALGGPLAEAALAVGLFAAITLAGTLGDSHGIGSAMVFAERASASQAGLPSDAELQSGIDGMIGRRHEEILRGLATMLATFAAGSALINLLPIGGSDGHQIWRIVGRRMPLQR
jgi:membrane-associated protease RseP (regulator of RpoE activity)